MRSTFNGLNTMVRGILANQLSLDTVGHNITNASTAGYSRQSVNLAATMPQMQGSIYGDVAVGTGVDTMSIERARNIYADKQFRAETSTEKYYETMQLNYDKIEAIFNDSDGNGIQNAVQNFWKSWIDLEANASTSSNRVTTIEQGKILSDTIQTATKQLQSQIEAAYEDLAVRVDKLNDITSQIVHLNKQIIVQETTGATANDLRDQRDLLCDELSEYVDITVSENSIGSYSIVSNGVTLVNNVDKLDLNYSRGKSNTQYGVMEYTITVDRTGIVFTPSNGILKADLDTIEENKDYIDGLANMAAFLMDTMNRQHRAGYGMKDEHGLNFFGNLGIKYTYVNDDFGGYLEMKTMTTVTTEISSALTNTSSNQTITQTYVTTCDLYGNPTNDPELYQIRGVQIIEALEVNGIYFDTDGDSKVAARLYGDESDSVLGDTAGFRNAILIGNLFNMTQEYVEENSYLTDVNGNKVYLLKTDEYGNYFDIKTYTTNFAGATYTTYSATRAIGSVSFNNYYISLMSRLGINAEAVDIKMETQQDVMTQLNNWRSSEMGVDWNEELTNMIKFQKGFGACARMLSAMDEILDRLVNNTGVVGR